MPFWRLIPPSQEARFVLPLERLILHITTIGLGNRHSLDLRRITVTAAKVTAAIEPGGLQTALRLEGADFGLHLES